jgi:hypothetical protein
VQSSSEKKQPCHYSRAFCGTHNNAPNVPGGSCSLVGFGFRAESIRKKPIVHMYIYTIIIVLLWVRHMFPPLFIVLLSLWLEKGECWDVFPFYELGRRAQMSAVQPLLRERRLSTARDDSRHKPKTRRPPSSSWPAQQQLFRNCHRR